MKICFNTARNENGSAIIIVVFLLAILTIIGISASNTTDVELNISGNDRLFRTAFYGAESGTQAATQRANDIINDPAVEKVPPSDPDPKNGLAYYVSSDALFDMILGQERVDGSESYTDTPDIFFTLGGVDPPPIVPVPAHPPIGLAPINAEIDFRRIGTDEAAGEAAEFGTGAEGIGGKQIIVIRLATASDGVEVNSRASAQIRSVFRKYTYRR